MEPPTPVTQAADLPVEGDVVAEKYRLERLIGEGGMGRVFLAQHLLLKQSVAIKFLRAAVDQEEQRARFLREARATMALRGDHVVRVFDLGVLPNDTPYMVLEYLEGTDLRALLAARGALPVAEAVDYVLQVCEALAEAHVNGIIHRDLKPQNLFLTHRANGTPCVKVLDFGVSKVESVNGSADELTMSSTMIGSPVYVPPEQIRDARSVDARSDIWSLGVVLYMLVGGGRPFVAEGLGATCAAIMVDDPQPLAGRVPGVPVELERVVFQCLEKSREQRVQSVAALAKLLAPFGSPRGQASAARTMQVLDSTPLLRAMRPVTPVPPAQPRPASHTITEIDSARREPPVAEDTMRAAAVEEAAPPPPKRGRSAALAFAMGVAVVAVVAVVWTARAPAKPSDTKTEAKAEPAPTPTPAASTSTSSIALATSEPSPPSAVSELSVVAKRALSKPAAPKPSLTAKKGQVDRNGVPILD